LLQCPADCRQRSHTYTYMLRPMCESSQSTSFFFLLFCGF
jgi:hypothetical protein